MLQLRRRGGREKPDVPRDGRDQGGQTGQDCRAQRLGSLTFVAAAAQAAVSRADAAITVVARQQVVEFGGGVGCGVTGAVRSADRGDRPSPPSACPASTCPWLGRPGAGHHVQPSIRTVEERILANVLDDLGDTAAALVWPTSGPVDPLQIGTELCQAVDVRYGRWARFEGELSAPIYIHKYLGRHSTAHGGQLNLRARRGIYGYDFPPPADFGSSRFSNSVNVAASCSSCCLVRALNLTTSSLTSLDQDP